MNRFKKKNFFCPAIVEGHIDWPGGPDCGPRAVGCTPLQSVLHTPANHKAENYVKLVAKLVKTCSKRDCRMSFKVHMLDANLDQFMENMGVYSEELGERFHQNISDFERCYPGQYNKLIMGDCIWRLIHESDLRVMSKI